MDRIMQVLNSSKDDGGVLDGGVDTDQSANTMTIHVTEVNDAQLQKMMI